MVDYKNIREEFARAERLEHPERLMRITLECAHFRLQTWQNVGGGGIGFHTNCHVCPDKASRLIVNMEETGVL